MSLDFQELRELISAIANTEITEFTLKNEQFELVIRKDSVVQTTELIRVSPPPIPTEPQTSIESVPVPITEPKTTSTPPPTVEQNKLLDITAPMVGTFYRAPAPEEPPFVDIGETISNGQAVCIIEAMKLMNEIDSEVSGKVVEILVENGDPVEFGQVLIRVDPG